MLSSPVSDLADREDEAVFILQWRRGEEVLDGLWLKVRYARVCRNQKYGGARTCQSSFVLSKSKFLCILKGVYLRDTGDKDQEAPPHLCITPLWTGLCLIHHTSLFISAQSCHHLKVWLLKLVPSWLRTFPQPDFSLSLSLQTLSWGSSQGQQLQLAGSEPSPPRHLPQDAGQVSQSLHHLQRVVAQPEPEESQGKEFFSHHHQDMERSENVKLRSKIFLMMNEWMNNLYLKKT